MIEQLLHPQLVQALGWTLLHSLWQGAAFALVLAVLFIALRSYTAQARYTVSAGLLAAFFLTVGGTFYQQWQMAAPNMRSAKVTQSLSGDAPMPQINEGNSAFAKTQPLASKEEPALIQPTTSAPFWKSATQSFSNYYSDHLPLLVTLWLMGVLVLQLRFLGQLAFVQRLKHYGTKAFPEAWTDRIETLEAKLRIQKKVVYRTTLRTSSPMVIGWMKPVILFPQLMLSKLSDTEIYAVLAHELAHVRRDDFAINLLQTLLTNVFFFHPGVWWMSNQVDEEREHCCDDLAVMATGEAMPYAKTLLNVSQLHRAATTGQPQLAMAMSGSDKRKKGSGFAERVKRLFSANSGAGTFREGFATALILFAGLGMAFAFTNQTEVSLAEELNTFEKSKAQKTTANATQLESATLTAPTKPSSPTQPSLPGSEDAWPITTISDATPIESISTAATATGNFSLPNPLLVSLLNAIKQGNEREVTELLDQGAPVNESYAKRNGVGAWTPLLLATSENELEIAKLLVGRGADVNTAIKGWTPLLEAADEGSLETLNFLLQSGANLNWYQGPNRPTALTMAASEGKLDCLLALLKAGADVNGFGESLPPLHAASSEGKIEVMRALIAKGADVNRMDIAGRTALMHAASEGNKNAAALLVSSLADPNIADGTGMRPVEFALEEGATELANFLALITDGPACATHLKDGHTEAHFEMQVNEGLTKAEMKKVAKTQARYLSDMENEAAERKSERAIVKAEQENVRAEEAQRLKELLQERAIMRAERDIIRAEKEELLKVLRREAEEGFIDEEEKNFRKGKDLELLDAIIKGETTKIRGILEAGANPNTRNQEGRTALCIAIIKNNPAAVGILLNLGANPSSRTSGGWAPIHFAALQGNNEILRMLISLDVDLDASVNYSSTDGSPKNSLLAWDYEGATPLLIAIENNDLESTKLLIAAGADPDAPLRKVEFTRVEADANGFGLSQVTNNEERLRNKNTTTFENWSPRLQATQQNNPKILALLERR